MKIEIANGGMTLETIAELAGGTLFADARKRKMTITGIATDSREVSEGTLFLGIRGERVDGNNFMETALAGGASAVLGERIPEGAPGVLVPDTVLALGRIATAVKPRTAFRPLRLRAVSARRRRRRCSTRCFHSITVFMRPRGISTATSDFRCRFWRCPAKAKRRSLSSA